MYCNNCEKKIRKNISGLCRACFHISLKKPRECQRCQKMVEHRGCSKILCISCYRKKERQEKPEVNLWHRNYKRKRKGKDIDLPNQRDGTKGNIQSNGYKTIISHGHPNAMGKKQRILEHVFVMSNHLKRPLFKGECVHHKNGIRDDNRIENLELWDKSHPPGQRIEDRIKFYTEYLEKHGYIISLKPV